MHIKMAVGLVIGLLVLTGAGLTLFQGYITPVLPTVASGDAVLSQIRLPPGFRIHLYADNLPGARSLNLSPAGTLFVGTRGEGRVYALRDTNGDHRADERYVLASGLTMPNGVAFRAGDLYVAEVSRVLRFDDIERHLASPPEPRVVRDDYPTETHHGWKFIAFGPDGWLYVPVGAPCNICNPEEKIYAGITRLNVKSGEREIFARGVRNTVGFDWHPETGELWFTDNGRDWLGDDRPPDELNRAPVAGMHFGYPFCHGRNISDPEFGNLRDCRDLTPAAQELGPHVASLGMRFYTGRQFPAHYRKGIFIAEHGSWNRKVPIGYRVMFVELEGDRAVSYEVFAAGWLQDGKATGRPVDVLVMPDGSLLVSDDKAGRIYRIVYEGPRQ